jgi:uncharacterized protein
MADANTPGKPVMAIEASATVLRALDNPLAFDHPIRYLRIIETHISWVILTGDYAYKIKKPVNFGFLDFSTLADRHHYCEEELRLNRRFAPLIYLDVVAIRGTPEAPRLHGEGAAIEYAVKMIEFAQQCLLSHHATAGSLSDHIIDAVAARVGRLHAEADNAPADSAYGSAESVRRWSEENLSQLARAIPAELMPASFARLQQWYRDNQGLLERVEQRRSAGRVRDCHGDLHLDNIALIDDQVMPFDCIEFNAELRWIDTISEAAFVAMDLQAHAYPGLCWRFISRYLEASADYDAIGLLRYYVIYRALVRAKVEALRVRPGEQSGARAFAAAFRYMDLADQWAGQPAAGIILMHGLSASGKSTVAARLVDSLGALQIRSDVVRKQLHDLAADANSGSEPGGGIYSSDASELTYDRLREIAAAIIAEGYCVIVDATFLHAAQRLKFLELADATALPCVIVDCVAPEAVLRERIVKRENDPSEANLQVLEQQFRDQQPIGSAEAKRARVVEVTAGGVSDEQVNRIRALLLSSRSADPR